MTNDNIPHQENDNDVPQKDTLRLDHFLKTHAISDTGGQAKVLIQDGQVKVNGQIETRRRRQLVVADIVEVGGKKFKVDKTNLQNS